MAVVYQHRRMDTGEIFYVGIGRRSSRASSRIARNSLWHSIVQKANGFSYEILKTNITWEEACLTEKQLIREYGRRDLKTGILANMTDGGDGVVGHKPTEESNKKRSRALLGRKKNYTKGPRKTLTEAHKIKLRKPKSTVENYKKPKTAESAAKSAAARRKVTAEQVDTIHKLFADGLTRGDIAKELGITIDLVQRWKYRTLKGK